MNILLACCLTGQVGYNSEIPNFCQCQTTNWIKIGRYALLVHQTQSQCSVHQTDITMVFLPCQIHTNLN